MIKQCIINHFKGHFFLRPAETQPQPPCSIQRPDGLDTRTPMRYSLNVFVRRFTQGILRIYSSGAYSEVESFSMNPC